MSKHYVGSEIGATTRTYRRAAGSAFSNTADRRSHRRAGGMVVKLELAVMK